MSDQVLVFTLGEERYCIAIDRIDEIVAKGDLTEIPNAPPQVRGVMDLRDETTTIVDPGRIFDAGGGIDADRVIVFESTGDHRLGWLVSQVHAVTEVPEDTIDSVSGDEAVRGVIRREDDFTIWVDPETVHEATAVSDVRT